MATKGVFDNGVGDLAVFDDKTIKVVTAAVTLKPYEQHVLVTTPAANSFAITLPPVAECAGRMFLIRAANTGGGEVSIADGGDTLITLSVGDNLSAAKDYVLLLNVAGLFWVVIKEVTT